MFTDKAVVHLKAGKGGNGIVAWRREKYLPKGGPTGGNGGIGGSVIVQVDEQLFSLDWFRNRRQLKAENGLQGGPNSRKGRRGKDLVLKVPCGTLIKDPKSEEVLFDMTEPGQKVVLCKGGYGGRGNESFKSPTHQAPNVCTPGKPGEERSVLLELKLIADVGLVGFPNAGKSTLINQLAKGAAKVGAYPFTTLHPNLGYLETETYQKIFLADIPGIIAGASHNKGLGLDFLRHVERTSLLIFLLDASGIDGRAPLEDFLTLKKEIEAYDARILDRPFLVVLNKCDTLESEEYIPDFQRAYPDVLLISAKEGEGLEHLKQTIMGQVLGA